MQIAMIPIFATAMPIITSNPIMPARTHVMPAASILSFSFIALVFVS